MRWSGSEFWWVAWRGAQIVSKNSLEDVKKW